MDELYFENSDITDIQIYHTYTQFVSWCWGYLGKNIRVPHPSCVITAYVIRQKFNSPDFVGFK